MIKIISCGDRLEKGNYKIHSRFKKAVNFISRESIATIVNEEIGSGPINIVVNHVNLNNIWSLTINDNCLLLNDTRLDVDVSKRFISRIECENVDRGNFNRNLDFFEKCLIEISPPKSLIFLLDDNRKVNFKTSFEKEFVKRFEIGTTKIFSSEYIDGIRMIMGAGFGFTPSGDDFICGLLIALNIARKLFKLDLTEPINKIYNTARGNNSISNAFLLCAKEGMMFEKFKKLVYSILYQGIEEIIDSNSGVVSVGETSGADMGIGFLMGLKKRSAILING